MATFLPSRLASMMVSDSCFRLVKPEKSRLVPAARVVQFLVQRGPMSVVTYSYARQNLAKLMDEAERDRAPIYISRRRKRGAAV